MEGVCVFRFQAKSYTINIETASYGLVDFSVCQVLVKKKSTGHGNE